MRRGLMKGVAFVVLHVLKNTQKNVCGMNYANQIITERRTMINGILAKFQPLKTGEVSVLVTTTKEHMHELVDLQDKGITIQAIQEQLPIQDNRDEILLKALQQLEAIRRLLGES